MDNAWLDSLSEDWISQPRSEGSPVGSIPSRQGSTSPSDSVQIQERSIASRIPLRTSGKQSSAPKYDSSSLPLSERSLNDNNLPLSQRASRQPSKLRNEVANSSRGRRTVSASTTGSVVEYHTVQKKSGSISPQKSHYQQETPEWKRRLLHGEVAYGDQRDLFSSAGLENIFKPPPAQPTSPLKSPSQRKAFVDESVMPSSPPLYKQPSASKSGSFFSNISDHDEPQALVRKEPRVMKYKLADQDVDQFSENDLSQSSSFRHVLSGSQGALKQPIAHLPLEEVDEEEASLPSNVPCHAANPERVFSGQSDVRHEDLSPIYISRHNTVGGGIDFAALDFSPAELHARLGQLSSDSTMEPSQLESEGSLPGDPTNNTDDFAHNGKFVNIGRGGKAADGSFQPQAFHDESVMLHEASIEASTPKQLPLIRKTRPSDGDGQSPVGSISPPVPRAPNPSPVKDGAGRPKSGGGSPLKLFGNYDTFTNQTLLRRLSQFENTLQEEESYSQTQGGPLRESKNETAHHTENEPYTALSSPEKTSRSPRTDPAGPSPRELGIFGAGKLDGYEFSEDVSLESSREVGSENDESAFDQVQCAVSRDNLLFNLQPSPALEIRSRIRRQSNKTTTMTSEGIAHTQRSVRRGSDSSVESVLISQVHVSKRVEMLDTPRKQDGDVQGKRLLYTPLKDPTPKRRRTLHKIDISQGEIVDGSTNAVEESHQHFQSIIGKKRKDARHGDSLQSADPEVMALRQVLKPRTITPIQRSAKESAPATVAQLSQEFYQKLSREQQEKIAKVQAELDGTVSLPPVLGGSVGAPMQDGSRKGSITTQDYLDEAKFIMAGIRKKARSGLSSVEESESDDEQAQSPSQEDHELTYESTVEPFSRPPSREGAPLARLPKRQDDPEKLNLLKKYQEMSDVDGLIANSMRSISLAKDAMKEALEIDRATNDTINKASFRSSNFDEPYASDPPNIQITEYPDLQRKRKHSTSSAPVDDEDGFDSQGSSASGLSTGRSIPTASSGGSDSRHVIAPHTISHLIPQQLAGMVFDQERRIWVKRKALGGQNTEDVTASDDTDDDPFGDIPDLTVDETQELQRIKAVAARQREEARVSEVQQYRRHEFTHTETVESEEQNPIVPEPVANKVEIPHSDSSSSSEPSRYTNFGSSNATGPGTRMTSWGDDNIAQMAKVSHETVHKTVVTSHEVQEDHIEEVEREISIHESRIDPNRSNRSRRNVTISFSSPLASFIQPEDYEGGTESEADDGALQGKQSDRSQWSGRRQLYTSKSRSASSTTSRKVSLGGHAFLARPVSRIDEQDEESFLDRLEQPDSRRSVSVILSTPLSHRHSSGPLSIIPSSVSRHTDTLLELTPLADFTMNQPDESFALEVSYMSQKHSNRTSDGKRTLSLAVKDLVQRITDVEPYEPFWEHLKQIELRGKKLQSLHMLSKFCSQLEELDVSENEISHMDGIPETVRHLRISHNFLTDLTSWNMLHNLQYLDVSNNDLTSLEGFKSLVHLRALRADNNKIRSLKGVTHLDGLISLRLRTNLIETVDFAATSLQRLTELDLKGNSIRDVRNLHELCSLTTLHLENNRLSTFLSENQYTLAGLKYLKLSDNILENIDVSRYPNLRLLYLDRNRLGTVTGLLKTKHMDSISMREQQDGCVINSSFLDEAFEVRKLFLSGNLLSNFAPRVDFLNLQYLELANCGLESLPVEFGQMMANVRTLNLNFNALKDLKPLLNIVRLKKLHLAGNRLTRLRKTTNVLAQFTSLTKVDLRNNPLTLGFYPPVTEKRVVLASAEDEDQDAMLEPFTLADGDREKDIAYSRRLDMETKMRRRVFEMLMLGGCVRLKMLDGLAIMREGLDVKDAVWLELVKAGVMQGDISAADEPSAVGPINDEVRETIDEAAEAPEAEEIVEERWAAEDSFA
jgi:Leucine-rich repeat (LRR) protein